MNYPHVIHLIESKDPEGARRERLALFAVMLGFEGPELTAEDMCRAREKLEAASEETRRFWEHVRAEERAEEEAA